MLTSANTDHLPSLDGLQAISIALVLLGHLGGTRGFVHVDLGIGDYAHLGVVVFNAFNVGKVCIIVHSPAGELATVCWAERVNTNTPCTSDPCVLIARCFALLQFSGMRLYPCALKAVDHLIPLDMSRLGTSVIECSIFNYASRKGILESGLQLSGTALEIGCRRITWQTNCA